MAPHVGEWVGSTRESNEDNVFTVTLLIIQLLCLFLLLCIIESVAQFF